MSNRSRTSTFDFYLYKNTLCTRLSQVISPTEVEGHIGLGVDPVGGGIRVTLISLHVCMIFRPPVGGFLPKLQCKWPVRLHDLDFIFKVTARLK